VENIPWSLWATTFPTILTHDVCIARTPSCVAFSILNPCSDVPAAAEPVMTTPFCRPLASIVGW
jgi:hypothetical protein